MYLLILSQIIGICLVNAYSLSDSSDLKGNPLTYVQKSSILPNYLQRHGKLGVNFNYDDEGPYIYCQTYDPPNCRPSFDHACKKTRVKCHQGKGTHRLGCMAAYTYTLPLRLTLNMTEVETDKNISETKDLNMTEVKNLSISEPSVIVEEPSYLSCWTQEESELRECISSDECIANIRRTGSTNISAKFCCCKTHDCNTLIITYTNMTLTDSDKNVELDDTIGQEYPTWAHVLVLSSSLLLFIFVSIICLILFQSFRRWVKIKIGKPPVLRSDDNLFIKHAKLEKSNFTLPDGTQASVRDIELMEIISAGHISKVFKGKVKNTLVAVKTYDKKHDNWQNELGIFSLQAVASHENISKYLVAFVENTRYHIVSLFCERGTLYDFLKAETPMLNDSVKIAHTMLSGLAFLHEEVIFPFKKPTIAHRDFKSCNILLKDDLTASITDFGLALRCERDFLSTDDDPGKLKQVGTRRYMCPELIEAATKFSSFAFQQIDVYAAGLVIWEIMSRTIISDVHGSLNAQIDPYLLPFERELSGVPTLSGIRNLVIVKKYRPQIRPILYENVHSKAIVRTMKEMWDAEPDARITSGCARDRFRRIREDIDPGCTTETISMVQPSSSSVPSGHPSSFISMGAMAPEFSPLLSR